MARQKDNQLAGTSPIQKWVEEYQFLHPTYVQFVRKLHELLAELLRLRGIDYHALESRAKDADSFREKIQRPGKSYTDPLRELPDMAALRIIAYYPDDIVRIREMLGQEFSIDLRQSTDKAAELAPDQFGYVSFHEVIALTDNRNLMTEWSLFKNLHAEVQIRTVLQHAWASISHKLQYKHETEVPRPLRRKLVRLSGLLELADEQFAELRRARSELTIQVAESIGANELNLTIDADSVMIYLNDAAVIRNIVAAVKKHEFPIVPKGLQSKGLSQLVTVCQQLKITTLADLNRILWQATDRIEAFFDAFARKNSDAHGDTPHWVAVVLAGIDNGERLSKDAISWAPHYTEDAFEAGRMTFGVKDARLKT